MDDTVLDLKRWEGCNVDISGASHPHVVERNSLPTLGSLDSLDSLDPRKVSFDICELYCYEVMVTDSIERRPQLLRDMKYMMSRLVGYQHSYGRLYNRSIVASFVVRICGRLATHTERSNMTSNSRVSCLINYSPEKWASVISAFNKLRNSMLRKDAALVVLPSQITRSGDRYAQLESDENQPPEDSSIDFELEATELFSTEFLQMRDLMKFHMCLSHIQPLLYDSTLKGCQNGETFPGIQHENILSFDRAIQDVFGDSNSNKLVSILNSLLVRREEVQYNTRSGGLFLKSPSETRKITSNFFQEFDLGLLQRKLLQLLYAMTEAVLPTPELVKLKYGCEQSCVKATAEAPKALRFKKRLNDFSCITSARKQRKRFDHRDSQTSMDNATTNKTLNGFGGGDSDTISSIDIGVRANKAEDLGHKTKALMKRVKDPLEVCAETAALARIDQETPPAGKDCTTEYECASTEEAPVKSSFLEKKASAIKISFCDSLDESGESETGGINLSDIPAPYSCKDRTEQHSNRSDVSVRRKRVTKRNKFTYEENDAIRRGVDLYGRGKWARIKSHFALELKNRDTVQIKDRYRIMLKNGEFD